MQLDVDEIAPEALPGIRILPILHERVDMAALTLAVLQLVDPALVAVELPTTLAEAVTTAVGRLPRISVILSEQHGADGLVWAVTPGDPLVQAVRWAHHHNRPVKLVDPDIRYRHQHADHLPDPWVVWQLGPSSYLELVRAVAASAHRTQADTLREKGMAYNISEARRECDGQLLCLVGAMHAGPVAELLAGPLAPPLARQRRASVSVHHLHPSSLTAMLPDPPLAHAVHEVLTEGPLPEETELASTIARRVELVREGLRLITGQDEQETAERHRAVLAYAAHHAQRDGPQQLLVVDRRALGQVVWRVAAGSYEEQTREQLHPWQERLFFDFARRYTRLKGNLVAGLWEWVCCGRSVADDNLAWEVFDCARVYPWQTENAELPTAKIDGDLLDLGVRRVRFRKRFFRVKQRPVLVPVRRRDKPEDPAEWLAGFDGEGICSYPPEDIVVEDYGRFLQHRALAAIAGATSHSEPFVSSMLDGVDIRETLAHWYEQRVWVKQQGRAPAAAGSVVVVFDQDLAGTAYPYHMTWLGEHDQESDMALYATDPTQQVVGPGIMRATYGGFMLTYPPGRLFDVWRDPEYRSASSKAEVLLLAGIDYSQHKTVVHASALPPPRRLHAYAAQQGKRILHIPLGSLSPQTIKKIRVVHILSGRDKRAIAKRYVW